MGLLLPYWRVVNRVSMTDNNRPEVLLSAADHWEDIKIRWQIHQYENESSYAGSLTCS